MAKRLAPIGVLILLVTFAASAGDIARFVNLGFSPDSRYFMFGQYGIQEKSSTPWAETFIVDVRTNAFVSRGMSKASASLPVDSGSDGIGALFDAVAEAQTQEALHKIRHTTTGRMLYILVDGAPAPDVVDFRDFQTGRNYEITMTQSPPSGEAGASFSLAISVTDKDGVVHTYKAGNPSFRRAGVKAYHIKEIILAPDNASLVFLIQREEQDTQGNNIRYMIETAGIN
jgi:predicted secreted protein